MSFYFEDYRSRQLDQKAFRASLIFGVIIGGFCGAAIELFANFFLDPNTNILMVIGISIFYLAISFTLYYLAFKKSIEMGSSTSAFLIKHPPDKLVTLYKGALDNCKSVRFHRILEDQLLVLTNEKSYKLANIDTLRSYINEFSEVEPSSANRALKSHLKEIREYPDFLHKLFDLITTKVSTSHVFTERGWDVNLEKDSSIVVSAKGDNAKEKHLLSIKIEKKINDTLEVPYACSLKIGSDLNDDEQFSLTNALNHLFMEIWSLDESKYANLDIVPADRTVLLESIRSELGNPLINMLTDMSNQLDQIENQNADEHKGFCDELSFIIKGLNKALPDFQEEIAEATDSGM